MNIQTIIELVTAQGLNIDSVEIKEFGTIIRACGESKLNLARKQAFEKGWTTPISCHREEGTTEACMIVWSKK